MVEPNDLISIAVAKGRIIQNVLPILARARLAPTEDPLSTRKLVIDTENASVRLIVVRSGDVPAYVRLGGADLGIVGKDVLLEQDDGKIYELADLGVSKCRIVVAEREDKASTGRRGRASDRVATKYAGVARSHFDAQGEHVTIVKLSGSVELAPLCGLADRIVDLVQSGSTLASNGMREVETIAHSSARLIANKASMRLKEQRMKSIADSVQKAAREHAAADR